MSKYILTHGSFREVSDDELMHWKYIKREKVNGKWVYQYDDTTDKALANRKKQVDQLKKEYDSAKSNLDDAKAETAIATQKVAKERYDVKVSKDRSEKKANRSELREAKRELRKEQKEEYHAEQLVKQTSEAYRTVNLNYMAKAITSFPERTISKGIVAIANFLNNRPKRKKETDNKTVTKVPITDLPKQVNRDDEPTRKLTNEKRKVEPITNDERARQILKAASKRKGGG